MRPRLNGTAALATVGRVNDHALTFPVKQGLYDPQYEHDACGVGFVVDLQGRKSHDIVAKALEILLNLEHRGACGSEKNTGDGAGILIQTPHLFLDVQSRGLGIKLPEAGHYAARHDLPANRRRRQGGLRGDLRGRLSARKVSGLRLADGADRRFPPRPDGEGDPAGGSPALCRPRSGVPRRHGLRTQALCDSQANGESRPRLDNRAARLFYVPSLSHKTVVYKGMLNADQIAPFYPDLKDPLIESGLAMVHPRFSTNTFPSWARAHPYRYVSHNGEINTLRGNVNWMNARQSMFRSELFGDDLAKLLPIIDQDGSDSAMFDNALELLVLAGRSLPHAVMMMIPEPWGGDPTMSPGKRAFYEYHASLMEPWDGPASIAFTDGVDRRRARSQRPAAVALLCHQGRPGRDGVGSRRARHPAGGRAAQGPAPAGSHVSGGPRKRPHRRGRRDQEEIAAEKPYARWLADNLVPLEALPEVPPPHEPDHETVLQRQQAFGYTTEDVKILMTPMAADGNEAVARWAMMPPWQCSPTSRSCCTTTSASCSPR